MSAYIVDDICIRRILQAFERAEYRREGVYAGLRPPVPIVNRRQEVAAELLKMNAAAVNQRYPDKTSPGHTPKFVDSGALADLTDWQVLKSLDCFLYQCGEGDIQESDLYKSVKRFRDGLERALVRSLPQYDEADWG